MLNKKIVKKIIFVAMAIFIIGLFTIYNRGLSYYEIFLSVFIFILLLSRYPKNKELSDLLFKKNNNELLGEFFKYSPDAVFLKDCNSKYISCNDVFFKMLAVKPEEVINKNDCDFLEPELAKRAFAYDRLIIQNRETTNYDITHIVYNGESKIFNMIKSPLIKNGEVVGILGIARDITFERNLKTGLEEKQTQITSILENMPFFVCMKDINGKIVRANKKSIELHGLEAEAMIGLDSRDLFVSEISEQFLEDDKRVLENKETIKREVHMETPSGPKWTEVIKSPIVDDDGVVQGIVIVHKDIEVFKEIEAQKETFVATLTHDLKVPTIAQIKALELLLNGSAGEISKYQDDILGQILNSCRYMLNMISTLLSTYRYEDGIKKINYEEFNFVALVSECCNEITCLAKEKEQKLIIKNDLVKEFICADKLEIKRVITNLISNAISYSLENSQIEISMEEADNELVFLVNSHNKLIPQHQLEKVFNKYVSNSSKFQQPGIGLGLYLTKQIIIAHNGEVIAQSDEVNGNTFGFRLPQKSLEDILIEDFSNKKESLEF